MENLIIESTFEKEGFIKLNLIKWEVHWIKNKKQIKKIRNFKFGIIDSWTHH